MNSQPSRQDAPNWQRAASVADVNAGKPVLVRMAGHQIALFATASGIRACNNRCPHEGYPLTEAKLDSNGVVTCNWHNWKFNLETGDNLLGGDCLRVYPLQVRGDDVWIDLARAPLETRIKAAFDNLSDALDDNDYARIAREVARLQLCDVALADIVAAAVQRALPRMEYGWTHALAGVADWLALSQHFGGDADAQLTCALEAIGHLADDTLREPEFPFTEAVSAWDEDVFVAFIAAEDEALAIATLHGALAAGLAWPQLEHAFARAALAHYHAFGHALIYVHKMRALAIQLPPQVQPALLESLTRFIVYARREDLLPEFRGYADALATFGRGSADVPDWRELRTLSVDKTMLEVSSASAGDPFALHAALTTTNASQLLGFDLAQQSRLDGNVADNTSWLDVTHGITFAEAALAICTRHEDMWPAALLQMGCFSGRNRGFAMAKLEQAGWHVTDRKAFFDKQREYLLDHGCDEFIASVHRLKTLLAADALGRADLSHDQHALLLASVNRYLHSPLKLKHARRTARQAARFVALDG